MGKCKLLITKYHLVLFVIFSIFGEKGKLMSRSVNVETTCCGIGIGNILAVVVSFSVNHSVLWAIFHGILGWFYVIYYMLAYGF